MTKLVDSISVSTNIQYQYIFCRLLTTLLITVTIIYTSNRPCLLGGLFSSNSSFFATSKASVSS